MKADILLNESNYLFQGVDDIEREKMGAIRVKLGRVEKKIFTVKLMSDPRLTIQ